MAKWVYRECERNHAAKLGTYMIDGCREYSPNDSSAWHCAACGCHRSYHRRVPLVDLETLACVGVTGGGASGKRRVADQVGADRLKRVTEPVILNGNSAGAGAAKLHSPVTPPLRRLPLLQTESGKKRRKTKFTKEQKEAMRSFAENLGWTLTNRVRKPEVKKFCERIGVTRYIFRTWLNNNKKVYGSGSASAASTSRTISNLSGTV